MHHSYLLLSLGASMPFKLIHASDTHITHADSRDNERKSVLALHRSNTFPHADEYLEEIGKAAANDNAVIAYTGDMIDFVSEQNLDIAREFTRNHDCIVSAGNHEFSQYVGEAWEDADYRNQTLAKVQASFSNDIRMYSRVINGIKLISLDNGYYLFDEEQYRFLKQECEQGLPVILLMHTPLYTPELHSFMMNERQQPCGYLCGTPESEMSAYPEYRCRQQKPDEITLSVFNYISKSSVIKCILTGHNHVDVMSFVAGRIPQYTIGLDSLCHITVC